MRRTLPPLSMVTLTLANSLEQISGCYRTIKLWCAPARPCADCPALRTRTTSHSHYQKGVNAQLQALLLLCQSLLDLAPVSVLPMLITCLTKGLPLRFRLLLLSSCFSPSALCIDTSVSGERFFSSSAGAVSALPGPVSSSVLLAFCICSFMASSFLLSAIFLVRKACFWISGRGLLGWSG